MPAQAQVDEISEYLQKVFEGIDFEQHTADTSTFRSAVGYMRKDMEVWIRKAILEREEIGFSYQDAVKQIAAKLTDPLEMRRRVVYQAIAHSKRLDDAVRQANRPLRDRIIENVWFIPAVLSYFALHLILPRSWTSQVVVADILGIIPFLLGAAGSTYFALHCKNPPKKSDIWFVIYWAILSISAGSHPPESHYRIGWFGPVCCMVGVYLGNIIGYELRRRKYSTAISVL